MISGLVRHREGDFLIQDSAILLLMLIAIGMMPASVQGTEWLTQPAVLWWSVFVGTGITLIVLELVRQYQRRILFLLLLTGIVWIIVFQGQLLPDLLSALMELWSIIRWGVQQVVSYLLTQNTNIPVAFPQLVEWPAVADRFSLYMTNLRADIVLLLSLSDQAPGEITIGTLLGYGLWSVSVFTTWQMSQGKSPWFALAPIVILISFVAYDTPSLLFNVIVVLFIILLLNSNYGLNRIIGNWRLGALPYGVIGEWWLWSAGIALSISAIIFVGYELTNPDVREAVEEFFTRPQPVSTTTSLSGSEDVEVIEEVSRPGVFPRENLLSGFIEQMETPVMQVTVPDLPPSSYYWKATSYDFYTGHGWLRNLDEREIPYENINFRSQVLDPPEGHILVRQLVQFEVNLNYIYVAGRPVRVNVPAKGEWYDQVEGDLASIQTVSEIQGYEAYSWLLVARPDSTDAADYPIWIYERYLTLPEDLPERVKELAEGITAEADTPYEQALAIQDYLRTYEYTLDIPPPPDDQDVVDYFLFDLKQGYCDYYATAMAVLARSVGLPARMAVGYASGAYDPETHTYHVTRAEAHSWVEIYFAGYGWVPFEPTPARPVINFDLPEGYDVLQEQLVQEAITDVRREAMFSGWFTPRSLIWLGLLPGGVLVFLLTAVLGVWVDLNHIRRQEPLESIRILYERLLGLGSGFQIPISKSRTPREFHEAFQSELEIRRKQVFSKSDRWKAYGDHLERVTDSLITFYSQSQYSPQKVKEENLIPLMDGWVRVYLTLWALRLVRRREE